MGTISDKLMRIINTKEDIRQALISKGYDVPTSIPFKEYAKMILDLPCKIDDFPELPGDVTRWHFGGLTNEMMAAMDDPRIEDADHKGRFLSFKNLAWGGMSGVGGYVENYNRWTKSAVRADITFTDHSFNVTSVKINQAQFYYQSSGGEQPFTVPSGTVIVKGLTDGQVLECIYTDIEGRHVFTVKNDGIYTLPSFDFIAKGAYYGFQFNKVQESCNITIEQLPLYPGALVFDGVDDYGVCDNFPILTKEKGYTVVALRSIIDKNIPGYLLSNSAGSNQGAFIFERTIDSLISSFGKSSPITVNYNNPLTYQTTSKYNQKSISVGELLEGGKSLVVGRNSKEGNLYANVAIWELVFLDHDATEEELTKIKDYFVKTYPWLFFDQAWTVTGKTNEDEDRATIANITGNGNDLVLSNFAFSGNSGYGEYAYNFNDTSWISIPDYGVISDKTSKSFNIKSFVLADYPVLYTAVNKDSSIKKVKIKVTNSIPGFYFGNKPANQIVDLSTDGIYEIPSYNSPNDGTQYGFRCSDVAESCDITIEQIPEYEGYLVADGVDDTIVSKEKFTTQQYFTIVGDWQFIIKEDKNSGVIINGKLYCYNRAKGIFVYVNNSSYYNDLADTIKIKALSSDGKVYDENWDDIQVKTGDVVNTNEPIQIAGHSQQSKYTRVAFKNIAIYNSLLSKDDCIKAYNYLQTIKSK